MTALKIVGLALVLSVIFYSCNRGEKITPICSDHKQSAVFNFKAIMAGIEIKQDAVIAGFAKDFEKDVIAMTETCPSDIDGLEGMQNFVKQLKDQGFLEDKSF